MLRLTTPSLHYRANFELDRIRGLLRGRARLERKVGLKRLFFLMRTQTRYRVEQKSYWQRSITRKNVDAAAREHGSGWPHLRNDLARQNIMLMPRMQQALAQYEPLAFRAVMELCASHISPPPPPPTAEVPMEAYDCSTRSVDQPHPASRRDLHERVERMLRINPHSVLLTKSGRRSTEEWMNAWKDFDVKK